MTDYSGRHPITYAGESEVENKTDRQEEIEAEEEFVINQIYGLVDFNRTIGSITQFIERTTLPQRTDQSQHGMRTREQKPTGNSLKTSSNSINLISKQPLKVRMDKFNGIDMEVIFEKSGHSPKLHQLRMERSRILKPDTLRIVGKGRDNERQGYRSSQQGRKHMEKLNIEIY